MVEAGLKSGHESARKWAAKFFVKALQYRQFVEVFDQEGIDGLRMLLNLVICLDFQFVHISSIVQNLSAVQSSLTAVYRVGLLHCS